MRLIKEFKDFALKGNMVDMAVGIIIGAAFGGIVQSLIKDVLMPIVGMFADVSFANAFIPLNRAVAAALEADPSLSLEQARTIGPVLAYGAFLTVVANFFVLAIVVFTMVKMVNTARKRFERERESVAPTPSPPNEDTLLLREIRDALVKS